MITVKDGNPKLNKGKAVVGFDLGNSYSQLSYMYLGEKEPSTISLVTGTEQYNIPTVLSKRSHVGQWYYGKEALKSLESGCILVDDLFSKAVRGEEVLVEDEFYDPVALLTLFVKRALSLLNMTVAAKDIEAFIFTVDELNQRVVEVLGRVAGSLGLKCDVVTYHSHIESFYHYMLHQPKELWEYSVLAFEYTDTLKSMTFQSTVNTKPHVVVINTEEYPQIDRVDWPEDENAKAPVANELDSKFKSVCENISNGQDITTVYLLGEGFKEGWAKESLKVLCRNRRVFQGNNLYSKGACYAMYDKLVPNDIAKEYVYLGEDKIKSNIGMKAIRRGEDSYYAILDAGTAWYEAVADFDMILDEGNEFSLVVTSLTGGRVIEKPMILDGLPQRPRGTTRLGFHIEMSSVNTLQIEITDKGFGEIIKSSGRAWNQSIII